MISITIDGVVQEAQAGERLIDVVNRTGSKVAGLLSPAAWPNPNMRHVHG
jgi:hypothetical protein